jgi:hypothetical protein
MVVDRVRDQAETRMVLSINGKIREKVDRIKKFFKAVEMPINSSFE